MQKLKRIKEDIKSPHPIPVINSSISPHAAFLSVSSRGAALKRTAP